MKELHPSYDTDDDRKFNVVSKFDKFTSWNLDSEPSTNDKIRLVMDWIDLSHNVNMSF